MKSHRAMRSKKFLLSQKDLMELLLISLERFSVKKKSRVVNPADPTEVTSIDCVIGMEYGLTLGTDEEWGTEFPIPENVRVHIVHSFGTEITIHCSTGKYQAYFDPSEGREGQWFRVDKDFFPILKRLVILPRPAPMHLL